MTPGRNRDNSFWRDYYASISSSPFKQPLWTDPVNRSTWKWVKHIKRFVRVLETLESPGVLIWRFQGLESPGKDHRFWNVLEICLIQAIKFSEFTFQEMYVGRKKNWFWNLENERVWGEIWSRLQISLSPGKVPENSLKFVSEKGYEPWYNCECGIRSSSVSW